MRPVWRLCRGYVKAVYFVAINVKIFDAVKQDFTRLTAITLVLHQLLEFVACATDGEPLVVKKITYAANHQHFMVLVVPTIAPALHRPQLGEFLLPISKHVRLDATQVTNFTDCEIAFCWNRWKCFLH